MGSEFYSQWASKNTPIFFKAKFKAFFVLIISIIAAIQYIQYNIQLNGKICFQDFVFILLRRFDCDESLCV